MLTLPIETPRLRLRRHAAEDRDAFIALVVDPRFHEHLNVPARQRTREGAAEVFDTLLASYETDEPVSALTVAELEKDAFIGTVALHPIPFGEALELFYAVTPERWGEGIASEAVSAVLEALPGRDILALCAPAHEASLKVARAVGMREEGLHQPLGGPERRRFVRPRCEPGA